MEDGLNPKANRYLLSCLCGKTSASFEEAVTMPESLHSWLQAQESAGTLESQGRFTLEQSKAWEKLGAYQLPFQDAWVLKLVQAAAASPGTRLAVRLTRVECAFEFKGPPDWNPEGLKNAIFDINRPADDALGHLAVAIRSMALLKTRPFSIEYPSGENEAWTGEAFAELPQTENPDCSFAVTVANYKFGESGSFFSLSRGRGSEFRARITRTLSSSCHLCSDCLTLDSRSPGGFVADPKFGNTERSALVAVLRAPVHQDWPPLGVAGQASPMAKMGHLAVVAGRTPGTAAPIFSTAALVALGYRKTMERRDMRLDRVVWEPAPHESEILWHCDGVVIEREKLSGNSCVGLGLLVSAKGLRTDLTGLRPLDNDEKRHRLRSALFLLEQLLVEFSSRDGGFKVKAFSPGVGLTGAAGLALLFSVPLLGAAVMTKAGVDLVSLEKRRASLESRYREGLRLAISMLQGRLQKL